MNNDLVLSGLYIYPIKSLKGIALDAATIEGRGLRHDRRWMLIDANNRFITQRECSKLATISVSLMSDSLKVVAEAREPLLVPFNSGGPGEEQVTIWSSSVAARVVSADANAWFSDLVEKSCRLVQMPDETRRAVNPDYAVGDDVVSFADAFPFLLASESSLGDLNSRLEEPLPMNRFRPNLVVRGALAFDEDNWKRISIGNTNFHVVKPCERCVVTTVDQDRGVRAGNEPLRTLATFRQWNNGVYFGQYVIAGEAGAQVRVGDPVNVLS